MLALIRTGHVRAGRSECVRANVEHQSVAHWHPRVSLVAAALETYYVSPSTLALVLPIALVLVCHEQPQLHLSLSSSSLPFTPYRLPHLRRPPVVLAVALALAVTIILTHHP